jgi:spermidine synthase
MAKISKWFFEYLSPNELHGHSIVETLFHQQTKFQEMDIVLTGSYGKALILDGKLQSNETDEFIYHEAIVHPAFAAHPSGPERVMIVGGGEGATLREVLRHRTVKRAVMVDIDQEVVFACRRLLPSYAAGAFDDPRTELRFEDARKYLEQSKERFDAIVIDIPDPVEEGPAYLLYTTEFYQLVNERLTEHGVITLQAGTAAVHLLFNLSSVVATLRTAFPVVRPFLAQVSSFGLPWSFVLATKGPDPRSLSAEEVDRRLRDRITGPMRWFDGESNLGLFHLPRYLREGLSTQGRIIRDNEPLFFKS